MIPGSTRSCKSYINIRADLESRLFNELRANRRTDTDTWKPRIARCWTQLRTIRWTYTTHSWKTELSLVAFSIPLNCKLRSYIARRDYMNTGYRIGCEGRPTHYNSKKPLLNSSGLLLFGFDGSAGLCNSTEFQNRATIRSQGEYTNTDRVVH